MEDIDYTFAPSSVDASDDDDDDFFNQVHYDYINDAPEKKIIEEDELHVDSETHVTSAPVLHMVMTTLRPGHYWDSPDSSDTTQHGIIAGDDQADYFDQENNNYFTTHSTPVKENFEEIGNELHDYYSGEEFDNDGIDNRHDIHQTDVEDYSITPQLKTVMPDSNFRSDFFTNMNIQEMVFTIPDHFRKYLQEPPEWINKDYW